MATENKGLINPISFADLVFSTSLVLPTNQETAQKLLHLLVREVHALRGDVAEMTEVMESIQGLL